MTAYGLDGPGIESPWRRDFSHPSRPALRSTHPITQRVPGLSQVYSGQGVTLTTLTHLISWLKNEQSYTSTSPVGHSGLLSAKLYLSLLHTLHRVMQSIITHRGIIICNFFSFFVLSIESNFARMQIVFCRSCSHHMEGLSEPDLKIL